MVDEIRITGELTPDPDVCRFAVDRPLLEEWSLLFESPESSLGSPLVDALFAVGGVAAMRVAGNTITVTKDKDDAWQVFAPELGKVIRAVLQRGDPPVSEAAIDVARNMPSEGIEDVVTELLDQRVNPVLNTHGGYVRLVKVEDRDVYVEMGGGCQGCAASQATLKYGVENAIREVAPQVRQVVDVTDHSSGTNPYYT
jgi:Fe-S cluster biogenesis protein NfuA